MLHAQTPLVGSTPRLASLDLVRGAVMVLMAIDHVRVYAGIPAGGPTAGIFLTRWVTHFCAPAFVFLAGTGAYLYGRRHGHLSWFLLTRGLWLIVLELTVIRVAWTFNFDFAHYLLAGVLWVIGWSMVLLSALARLPVAAVAPIGLALIGGHNLLDARFWALAESLEGSSLSELWKILYFSFFAGPVVPWPGGPPLMVLYSIVPWAGVMAAGYAFGAIAAMPDVARRRRTCAAIGCLAIVLFVVLRGTNVYGDPNPWGQGAPDGRPAPPPLLDFLNTTKYPASLAFLLMTLGPTIAVLPLLEQARGVISRWLIVFGRVPFFFYLLHIPLIHFLALVVSLARTGSIDPWLFANHPMGNPPPPPGYTWSLAQLYAVWAIAVVLLYPACRWFAEVKARRKDWWLSYL